MNSTISLKPETINDFTFIYNDVEIPISKYRFALNSIRFQKLDDFGSLNSLRTAGTESISNFKDFLSLAQDYDIKINKDNILEILQASREWNVPKVEEMCNEKFNEGPNLQILMNRFLNSSDSNSERKNFENILASKMDLAIQTDSFKGFPIGVLLSISKNPNFRVLDHVSYTNFVMKQLEQYHRSASPLALKINLEQIPTDLFKKLMSISDFDTSCLGPSLITKTASLIIENEQLKAQIEQSKNLFLQLQNKLEQLEKSTLEMKTSYATFCQAQSNSDLLITQKIQDAISSRASESEAKAKKDLKKTNSTVNGLTKKVVNLVQTTEDMKNEQERMKIELNAISKIISNREEAFLDGKSKLVNFCDDPLKGIFSSFFDEHKELTSIIKVTASSSEHGNPETVINSKYLDYWSSLNQPDQWIQFEFLNSSVTITYYTIKTHPYPINSCHLKSWILEGSNDKISWAEIDEQDTDDLNIPDSVVTIQVSKDDDEKFRYIRLRQCDVNHRGDNILALKNIELFGILFASNS